MKTALQTLTEARALIEDEEHWTQGAYARTWAGDELLSGDAATHPEAAAWCAAGAIQAVTLGDRRARVGAMRALARALGRGGLYDGHPSVAVIDFNDGATHSEVLEVFDEATAWCAATPIEPDEVISFEQLVASWTDNITDLALVAA